MSTEENEAIEILNNSVKNNGGIAFQDNEDSIFKCYDTKPIKVALDMIKDKQSKIKVLAHTNKTYKGIIKKKDKEIKQLKERIADLESQLFEAEEYLNN